MPAAAGNHPGHQPGTTQARRVTGQGQLPCARKGPNFVSVSNNRQVRQSPDESHEDQGRNAAHCPGRPLHPQGHPKILSDRSAESIFRTHPCARSLCRPSGPDGEGQAGGQAPKARGEPPRRAGYIT
jgi:hypothetical protein